MSVQPQKDTQDRGVTVKAFSALTPAQRACWMQLRESNPKLYSPYFHIDYTEYVDRLRDDVRVVIVQEAGQPIAFLPIQGMGFARSVGAPMTDYQAFIKAPETVLDVAAILKETGIGSYHFDAFIDDSDDIIFQAKDLAAVIDVSSSAPAWRENQNSSYRRHYKTLKRRVKRAEKELGSISYEMKSRDREIFDQLIEWKQNQFALTGKYDVLGAGWTLDLLRSLWERGPQTDLRCDLHVLRINGDVAAIDMGLTDGRTYHSWMVSYNPEMRNYSPGIQLLETLIDKSHDLGYDIIDLGVGVDGYKRNYQDLDVPVGIGFIAAAGPAAALSRVYNAAENLSEKAPLGPISRLPGKLRRRYIQIAACDTSAKGRALAMMKAIKNSRK